MPPSPVTHTPLNKLVIKFLKSIDSYNSSDTTLSDADTDNDTSGERARLCINFGLHLIYDLIKDSKYLENYPVTTLASTLGQDYIDLDPEAFLDEIDSINETSSTDVKLTRKSWSWYKRNYPDPSNATGDPLFYIRRGNRIYLAPRPSAARTYEIAFRKLTKDLLLPADLPLIPTRYDQWIVMEAMVKWYLMEDPTAVPAIVIAERDTVRQAGIDSVKTSYDTVLQSESNCEANHSGSYRYSRPIGG